jgi:hypothetical protein
MPKRVSEEVRRIPLNCLIAPATREILKRMDCSQGEAVDRCVAMYNAVQERKRVFDETGDPWKAADFLNGKDPTPKPSEKRGLRQEGG